MIAPGMTKKISVIIRVSEDEPTPAAIKETIKILSKHDVFSIPMTASLLSTEAFEEQNHQKLEATGKPIQNSRVREKLIRAMAESRQSKRGEITDPDVVLTKKPHNKRDRSRDDSLGGLSNNKTSKSGNSHL